MTYSYPIYCKSKPNHNIFKFTDLNVDVCVKSGGKQPRAKQQGEWCISLIPHTNLTHWRVLNPLELKVLLGHK